MHLSLNESEHENFFARDEKLGPIILCIEGKSKGASRILRRTDSSAFIISALHGIASSASHGSSTSTKTSAAAASKPTADNHAPNGDSPREASVSFSPSSSSAVPTSPNPRSPRKKSSVVRYDLSLSPSPHTHC